MRFLETAVSGAYVIEPELFRDERGFFARTWCQDEFASRGLASRFAQCSVSYNASRHTLRGLHYQAAPHEEARLVRCTRGRLYDLALDLRPASPTFLRWAACELSAENHRALYVPEGCAHGFQTLEDDTEVCYQISVPYAPEAARGVRWDDPAFGIAWPEAEARILSARDRAFADFIG